MMQLFPSIIETYWGGSFFQWLFYFGLLIVFIMEKDHAKRQLFFWYPVLVFAALTNPLTIRICVRIWGEVVAYFCRQFSLLPVFYTIAFAGTLLVRDLRGRKKCVLVCVIALCIVLSGQWIYTCPGYAYERADSLYKIPSDLMQICDRLSEENEDVTLATSAGLSYMVRQYDPSIRMATSVRDGSDFATALGSSEPNVSLVMSRGCSVGCDYVVVNNEDSVRSAFERASYEPYYETVSYLVYACSGYAGHKNIYNEKDELIGCRYFDENGTPAIGSSGYASVRYERDDSGNIIAEYYYDTDDQPLALSGGYFGVTRTFNADNRVTELGYLDADKNPMNTTSGYCFTQYTYDANGNTTDVSFYDTTHQGVLCTSGYAGYRQSFDADNHLIEILYYDLNRDECNNTSGYSRLLRTYDGSSYTDTLYDVNGEIVE